RKFTLMTMSPAAPVTVALRVTERFTGLTGAIMAMLGGGQSMLFMSIMEHDMPMELLPMTAGALMEVMPEPPPPQLPRSAATPASSGSDAADRALRSCREERILRRPPRVPTQGRCRACPQRFPERMKINFRERRRGAAATRRLV